MYAILTALLLAAAPNPTTRSEEPCVARKQLVQHTYRLVADQIYVAADNAMGYDLLPIWEADELATVVDVVCPAREGDSYRVVLRLHSNGRQGYIELPSMAHLDRYLRAPQLLP